jgi:hypothetical protein
MRPFEEQMKDAAYGQEWTPKEDQVITLKDALRIMRKYGRACYAKGWNDCHDCQGNPIDARDVSDVDVESLLRTKRGKGKG